MEIHTWIDERNAYIRFHRIIVALENAGFEKWFVEPKAASFHTIDQTGKIRKYAYQVDMGFVNTNIL